MTRIKIFVDNSQREMEAAVNQWLESHADIQIKQLLQDSYSDIGDMPWITLTILYDIPSEPI